MVIKYVAGDGTGDWDADGSYDQVPINQALRWAYETPGNEIHLTGPFTYDIYTTVLVGSNTTFSGDSDAILKLNNSCEWSSMVPVIGQIGGTGTVSKNIEISGFQINCNESNLYGVGGRIHGKGYYNAIHIQGQKANKASGINIHNLKIYNSMGDGARLVFCNDASVHDCELWNLEHCSVFCIDSTDLSMYNNTIQAITCSGIRFDNCRSGTVRNNTITDWTGTTHAPKKGEHGVQVGNEPAKYGHTALTSNIEIYDNVINVGGSGIQIEDYLKTAGTKTQAVDIHNNSITGGNTNWASYFAGISIYSWGNGITISKNTIDGSARAGILGYSAIASGVNVYVTSNNILNTVSAGSEGGYGIWNKTSALKIIANSNYLAGNIAGKYKGVNPGSESDSLIDDAVPGGSDAPDEPEEPDEPAEPPNEPDYPEEPEEPDEPDEPYEPIEPVIPNPPTVGCKGFVIESDNGYIFQPFVASEIGDKILIVPVGNEYIILKLAEDVALGDNITMLQDHKGNYYAIEGV